MIFWQVLKSLPLKYNSKYSEIYIVIKMLSKIEEVIDSINHPSPSSSDELRVNNFFDLVSRIEKLSEYENIKLIYRKNAALLKKNIKFSPVCPTLQEIKVIYNELFLPSLYFFFFNFLLKIF